MSLPPEVEASYITIIDDILAASDLDSISEKRIRKGLQESVEYDITPQKSAIKALIMARFDKFDAARKRSSAQTNGHVTTTKAESSTSPMPTTEVSPPPPMNHKQKDDDDDLSDVRDSPAPKKKKRKIEYDSDAVYAAKLQAQENGRIRSTRGGGPKPAAAKKKKTPKKKTSAKVKAEDDSDLDGSDETKERKVNRSGGFHKELWLSPALSALLDNETKLSRPQTVKRIWAYVRAHDLQDPSDKRMIRCDDSMRAVFKQDKVHMFTMNKILSQNMYNMDE
ncbi:hypothetical protein N7G274_001614 [Stereocaulon virgatum]|uniref:SWIB-domain-containing protein n=1 Tax=Stereocaulon virgatum TaxID=373712 RepID=A0ABR4AK70_9LECA